MFAVQDTSAATLSMHFDDTYPTDIDLAIFLVVPQGRLADDDLDTEITIPTRALELGTLWWAFEERGEELGSGAVFSERKYRTALDDAIGIDQAAQGDLQLVIT